jgi:hypothetical protein
MEAMLMHHLRLGRSAGNIQPKIFTKPDLSTLQKPHSYNCMAKIEATGAPFSRLDVFHPLLALLERHRGEKSRMELEGF